MPLIPPGKSPIPLPIQERLGEFFTDLLGKGCAVSKASVLAVDPDEQTLLVASYVDDLGRLSAVVVHELMLAASCGAALAMVPAMALDEVKKSGELPEFLAENFYEVANIFAGVLNGPNSPHVKLSGLVHAPPEAIPADVAALLAAPGARRDYDVTIEGYGGGRFALVTRPS